ncbi:MAG: SAM-dependent DNA methyltransferase [Thermoguttaceae bacterium]|nr:SAM-dependent DNA methyltransferase [Thermoguttaceae bacterium]
MAKEAPLFKTLEEESKETTTAKLFNYLFEACNILRGPINQDEYKSYVIPILFFKRMSDVYDEETAKAKSDYGAAAAKFEEEELHKFLVPPGCHWNDVRETSEDVGKAIVDAMTGIEKANPTSLSGLFSSFDDANWTDKNKLSDARLKELVEHMSTLKVGNQNYSADVMGDAYEYLIKKFADLSKKNAGEFYTPRSVVRLMIRILNPQPGETVYDGACGTGGMLIEAIRHMNDSRAAFGRIFGQEKNLATSAIARMNLYLHGAEDFRVEQGDTLRNPLFIENNRLQTFDCVVANPPFGMKKWGADVFAADKYGRNEWGSPTDSSADFAWIQHFVKSTDPKKGRAAVVMPQGALFHSGKDGEIRRKLVESDKLEGAITLVGGLFYGSGVSACVLITNNAKPKERRGKIMLVDASTLYTPLRAQNVMTEENVEEAFKLYTGFADVPGKSKLVSIDDVKEKGYSLAVNGYIEQEAKETIDPEAVKKRFFEAVDDVKRAEDKLRELLKKEGLLK